MEDMEEELSAQARSDDQERALAAAEARGYARGTKDRALAISEQGAWADAIGYARGVEEAKQLIGHYGLTVAEVVEALDALLKPKGEAK